MEGIGQSPGTVSRILWHFTGGPVWNDSERRQGLSPKPAAQAFGNLESILKTCELRLGAYKEVIHVRLAEDRTFNRVTQKAEIQRNVRKELASSPVCCLADVPIIHLSYLANRYGKFAIGFHREPVVRHGFNPVFYALDDAESVLAIYRGLAQLNGMSGEIFKVCSETLQESLDEFLVAKGIEEGPDLRLLKIISQQADYLDRSVRKTHDTFKDFLGLVKTFSSNEFGTIYCEREWRSLKQFRFTHEDVAMIVLPRKVGKVHYFQPFCQSVSESRHLPATIPIVPWEDLIEH